MSGIAGPGHQWFDRFQRVYIVFEVRKRAGSLCGDNALASGTDPPSRRSSGGKTNGWYKSRAFPIRDGLRTVTVGW